MAYIPYGRQHITADDIAAVIEVMQSDWLTQGPVVPQFERAVAQYCGSSNAIAVNSATSALHIACLALGLTKDDWLWTSPITFVASANCALYCGANVDFVDINPRTYNMCPEALALKLERANVEGRLPKIVVPVHLCGQSCDMSAIRALSRRYGFRVIEDASHSIGGKYLGSPIGDCSHSDITILSFHPVKVITTAEGGMALTNDAELADRMSLLRSHGITRDVQLMRRQSEGAWYYEQIDLGFNYRMTELHAALGVSQLKRLETYVARRHTLAARYDRLLASLPLTTPWRDHNCYSAFHLYVIRLQLTAGRRDRREVFDSLRAQGIGANVHYIPVHLQAYYQRFGFHPGQYPEAERYYAEAISLPLYPAMEEEQQDHVIAALHKAINE